MQQQKQQKQHMTDAELCIALKDSWAPQPEAAGKLLPFSERLVCKNAAIRSEVENFFFLLNEQRSADLTDASGNSPSDIYGGRTRNSTESTREGVRRRLVIYRVWCMGLTRTQRLRLGPAAPMLVWEAIKSDLRTGDATRRAVARFPSTEHIKQIYLNLYRRMAADQSARDYVGRLNAQFEALVAHNGKMFSSTRSNYDNTFVAQLDIKNSDAQRLHYIVATRDRVEKSKTMLDAADTLAEFSSFDRVFTPEKKAGILADQRRHFQQTAAKYPGVAEVAIRAAPPARPSTGLVAPAGPTSLMVPTVPLAGYAPTGPMTFITIIPSFNGAGGIGASSAPAPTPAPMRSRPLVD